MYGNCDVQAEAGVPPLNVKQLFNVNADGSVGPFISFFNSTLWQAEGSASIGPASQCCRHTVLRTAA